MPGAHRLDRDHLKDHLPALYRAARAWTASREDAEDLMQETLLRVLARPRLVRDELGYLVRALRNTLADRRRAAARRPPTVSLVDDLDDGRPGSADPAETVAHAEVFGAIAELPGAHRDALVAVDVAGLSYGEAARVLGVPQGTLTSRLFRARDRLAARLEAPDAAPRRPPAGHPASAHRATASRAVPAGGAAPAARAGPSGVAEPAARAPSAAPARQ